MKRALLIVLALLWLAAPVWGAEGQDEAVHAAPRGAGCKDCHWSFQEVLPGGHAEVTGETVLACLACHTRGNVGIGGLRPYSARLHLAHARKELDMPCTACHTWAPGEDFGLPGATTVYGRPSREELKLLEKVTRSWAESAYLDALHGKKMVSCGGCHGEALPTAGDTVETERCLGCHGSPDRLAARTAPQNFPDRNPHESHLGPIDCTVCHTVHAESKVYCLDCHPKFEMRIPGGA